MRRAVLVGLSLLAGMVLALAPAGVAPAPWGDGVACRWGDLAMRYGMVDGAPVGFANREQCERFAAQGGTILTSTFTVTSLGVDPNDNYWYRYEGTGLMPGAVVHTYGTKYGPSVAADGTVNFGNYTSSVYCRSGTQFSGSGTTTTAGGAKIVVYFTLPKFPCADLKGPQL